MEKILKTIISNDTIVTLLKLILVFISTKILIKYSTKLINNLIESKCKQKDELRKKYETLGNVATSLIRYSLYSLCVIIQLSIIFGPIPLTFAGVGAAIVGFGTQNLINDIISGFFILFENQYSIGDHVTILNNEGIVEAIELRITKIRAFNGDLFILPNGSITQVINHSKGPQRFEIIVTVDYKTKTSIAEKVIIDCCNKINKNNSNIIEPSKLIGITEFANTGFSYRILGKCVPLTKIEIESSLRALVLEEFQKNNIQFAKSLLK